MRLRYIMALRWLIEGTFVWGTVCTRVIQISRYSACMHTVFDYDYQLSIVEVLLLLLLSHTFRDPHFRDDRGYLPRGRIVITEQSNGSSMKFATFKDQFHWGFQLPQHGQQHFILRKGLPNPRSILPIPSPMEAKRLFTFPFSGVLLVFTKVTMLDVIRLCYPGFTATTLPIGVVLADITVRYVTHPSEMLSELINHPASPYHQALARQNTIAISPSWMRCSIKVHQGTTGSMQTLVGTPTKNTQAFLMQNDDDDAIDQAGNPDGMLYRNVVGFWVSSGDHEHHGGLHIDIVVQ